MHIVTRAKIGSILETIIIAALLMGLAGNLKWIEGWIFIVLFIMMLIAVMIPLFKNKKMLEERLKPYYHKKQKPIDKVIITIIYILGLAWFIIMPLDAVRFEWSPQFPIWLTTIGIIGFFISNILLYLVFKQNAFLSPVVKKQEKHKVVSTGLYGIVRHPMYSAVSLMMFSGSVVLGSLYGVYINIALAFILFLRTFHEEKVLENELKGYKEYKKKVTKRLIPFVL
jgi:protein-S-isoprenylcysteine O-methyltransferase Ste14